MRKTFALSFMCAVLLGACGGSATPALGQPGDPDAVDRTIEVTATEFKLDPEEIEVAVGETVEFVVTNEGQAQHEFSLATDHAHHQGMEQAVTGSTGPIDPGETATLVWSFPEAGEMPFACHIDAHDEQGMVGTLTVTD